MAVFECNVKVGHVGYFIIGDGMYGRFPYGYKFLPLNTPQADLDNYEDNGYMIDNVYVSDTMEEFISQ
jgi:hypothetical protein